MINHLEFGASTIALIYKDRWEIEIFFKTLEQTLKVKTFVGTSENTLRIQIWTALIALLLITWLHHLLMQEFYVGLFEEVGRTNLFITHEIDEAIFLADRLVIMTYQPGEVKAEIEIDLPRPREFHMLASQRFMEIREQAIELLYEEAAKAFASGSKSAYDLVGAMVTRKGSCNK